ncbi:DUF397 domain-containing protein [Nocardiopsis tropica]|uniref:DUF397 domain-containing protein n=2 Tax=Nocardiopsis tropica TaxID=109330 RepID=A0ABU7KLZ9_9ACTN|nr:DUF397 domain-containing protein [Nocardiopsis umidischolae]MEE2050286.1 DUF397 domain-containing protein [Nocardiopsis umidischolae]
MRLTPTPTPTPADRLVFRKSSYSTPQNCVEVADMPSAAAVRDSQNPGAGHLEVPAIEWSALIRAATRP